MSDDDPRKVDNQMEGCVDSQFHDGDGCEETEGTQTTATESAHDDDSTDEEELRERFMNFLSQARENSEGDNQYLQGLQQLFSFLSSGGDDDDDDDDDDNDTDSEGNENESEPAAQNEPAPQREYVPRPGRKIAFDDDDAAPVSAPVSQPSQPASTSAPRMRGRIAFPGEDDGPQNSAPAPHPEQHPTSQVAEPAPRPAARRKIAFDTDDGQSRPAARASGSSGSPDSQDSESSNSTAGEMLQAPRSAAERSAPERSDGRSRRIPFPDESSNSESSSSSDSNSDSSDSTIIRLPDIDESAESEDSSTTDHNSTSTESDSEDSSSSCESMRRHHHHRYHGCRRRPRHRRRRYRILCERCRREIIMHDYDIYSSDSDSYSDSYSDSSSDDSAPIHHHDHHHRGPKRHHSHHGPTRHHRSHDRHIHRRRGESSGAGMNDSEHMPGSHHNSERRAGRASQGDECQKQRLQRPLRDGNKQMPESDEIIRLRKFISDARQSLRHPLKKSLYGILSPGSITETAIHVIDRMEDTTHYYSRSLELNSAILARDSSKINQMLSHLSTLDKVSLVMSPDALGVRPIVLAAMLYDSTKGTNERSVYDLVRAVMTNI